MNIYERFALASIVARGLFPRSSIIVGVSSDHFTLLHTHASTKGILDIHRAFYESTEKLAEYVANNSGIEG